MSGAESTPVQGGSTNLNIFMGIRDILFSHGIHDSASVLDPTEDSPTCQAIHLYGSESPGFHVEMVYGSDPKLYENQVAEFAQKPNDMSFPLCVIYWWWTHSVQSLEIQTPYGKFPSYVIGKDNRLYHFSNMYFFSEDGNGSRFEEVIAMPEWEDLATSLWEAGLAEDQVPRLAFTPYTENSKHSPLDANDQSLITDFLQDFAHGRLAIAMDIFDLKAKR